ncbi:MAG: hypothetical protein ACRCXZ_09820 [Patescibacteria group bacterium]
MPHTIFTTKNYENYENYEIVKSERNQEISLFVDHFRNGIWAMGIPSWLFAISDRLIAILSDSYISIWEITQLFTVFSFFISWLYLKPEISLADSTEGEAKEQLDIKPEALDVYKNIVAERMIQLQEQHIIQQNYVLPFPYQCQIYHLLNLKHLETIHSFSLNNLKVINVIHTQTTNCGGRIKFQTVLDSPFNVLRIWRQPIVEVNLTLHTPYTVELSIPLYKQKQLAVIFNAIPLSDRTHRLFIDIYSDLKFPKPILKWILHLASSLTLFEDLPYLRKLATKNTHRLGDLNTGSNCKTMWLYQRFITLYGQL